jgi:SAM-dependent methyltransferase
MTMNAPILSYDEIVASLRSAYDRSASERDLGHKEEWKVAERSAFLGRLHAEGSTQLIEIGAGTGQDSVFFQENGLRVVATDISAEMVARCRAKGVEAHVMDVVNLSFPSAAFDAGYAFNSLLHVPNTDLAAAFLALRRVLSPGALLYLGMYGGEAFEGVRADDWHDPPRFFSLRTDQQLLGSVRPHFELVDFHVVMDAGVRFQALTLRRPAAHRHC